MKGILEKRRYDSDFELWCRCYQNIKFLAHYHTEVEMVLVRGGKPQIAVNNHTYFCAPGDIMIFNSGDIHFNEHDSSENELDFIVFNPVLLGELYSARAPLPPHLPHEELQKYGLSDSASKLFYTIHKEMREREPFYEVAVESVLRAFWVEFRRHISVDEVSSEGIFPNRLSRLRNLLDYIDRHYDQDLPLSKAADLLGYDVFHCSKTFKAITGVNYITYLNTVRVGKALEALRQDDRSMISIALDCGFNNPRTFNRVFKEITRMTPSEYLKTFSSRGFKGPDNSAQNHTILSYSDSYL